MRVKTHSFEFPFNNFGLYFAYNVTRVLDRRLGLVALLGMQGISFAPRGLSRTVYNEAVFPQGFEISYSDAFGLKNKSLSGGMFFQTSTKKPYNNVWLRFGGRLFGELNYLSWSSGDRWAHMWGVSVGAPFAQFL